MRTLTTVLTTLTIGAAFGTPILIPAFAPCAQASVVGPLFLTLQDGNSSASLTLSGPSGTTLQYNTTTNGPIGGFSSSDIEILSNSPGSTRDGELDINNINLTNTSAVTDTLTLTFGDINFTGPGNAPQDLTLSESLSGEVLQGIAGITFTSYADGNNGEGTTSGPLVASVSGSVNGTSSGGTPQDLSIDNSSLATLHQSNTNYSMTDILAITLSGGASVNLGQLNLNGGSSTFAPTVITPEPASLALMASAALIGFFTLPLLRRRPRRA